MMIVALSAMAKIRQQLKCPPTAKRIKEMWFVHTMEH